MGVAASNVLVIDATTIQATTGSHATGAANVSVTNSDGSGAVLSRSFFFYSPAPRGLGFFSLTPCRVLDTREADGPALAPSDQRIFKVTGKCGIPASAVALVLNLTIISGNVGGAISAFPGNAFPFVTNAVAYSPGRVRATGGVQLLATDGTGTLGLANVSSGSVQVVLDVAGYFE